MALEIGDEFHLKRLELLEALVIGQEGVAADFESQS